MVVAVSLDDLAAQRGQEMPCKQGNPDDWFSETSPVIVEAQELCAGCAVKVECLEGATRRREPFGVWGGQLFMRGEPVLSVVTTRGKRGPSLEEFAELLMQVIIAYANPKTKRLSDRSAIEIGRLFRQHNARRLDPNKFVVLVRFLVKQQRLRLVKTTLPFAYVVRQQSDWPGLGSALESDQSALEAVPAPSPPARLTSGAHGNAGQGRAGSDPGADRVVIQFPDWVDELTRTAETA